MSCTSKWSIEGPAAAHPEKKILAMPLSSCNNFYSIRSISSMILTISMEERLIVMAHGENFHFQGEKQGCCRFPISVFRFPISGHFRDRNSEFRFPVFFRGAGIPISDFLGRKSEKSKRNFVPYNEQKIFRARLRRASSYFKYLYPYSHPIPISLPLLNPDTYCYHISLHNIQILDLIHYIYVYFLVYKSSKFYSFLQTFDSVQIQL